MPKRIPKLCHHKPTGQSYVRIDGRFRYLGDHGSDEAQQRYEAIVATIKRDDELGSYSITVPELALLYKRHAKTYYVKDGKPTSEVYNVTLALRPLVKRYRKLRARDFSPKCLKAVRDDMMKAGCVRTSINRQVDRIRRLFKWAVSEEIVPPTTYTALPTVTGLKAGRCDAVESEPVEPVPDDDVEAVKPYVSRQVWAAIQLQLLTGARPSEILLM